MGFTVQSTDATLKHLNVRKDGPDDDQALAVDVKLEARLPASVLPPLVADEGRIEEALWLEDGSPRFWSITQLRFETEFRHHVLRLAGMGFWDVTLRRFVVTPQDGHEADVTFQAQIHPRSTEVAALAEYVSEDIRLSVEPEGELPLEGGGRPDAEVA